MSKVLVEVPLIAVLADTGPPSVGGDPIVGSPFDPGVLVGLGILAVAVLTVTVLMRRPGWRRPVAALLMVLGSGVVALLFVLGALFSDWSGQHRIAPIPLIVGVVVMVIGLWTAVRIVRGSPSERGR